MTKHILSQYCDLQEEVKDLRRRIKKLETQIQKIEDGGNVIDSVTGGYGGTQHFKIEGFPYPEYSKKKTSLYLYKAQLEMSETELTETLTKVEEYIQTIKSSRIRNIIRYRFIDSLTWRDVSAKMGYRCTEESVRKEYERFIAEN